MSEDKKDEAAESAPIPFVRYDDYWLQKARTLIDGSIELFSARLATLNNFLNYLALGTFLGGITYTTYKTSTRPEVFGLFVLPLICIAIAKYMVSVGGSDIVMKEKDMRSPTQINDGYNDILKTLSLQVKDAAWWVGFATAVTVVCFPFAMYFQNVANETKTPKSYLSVQSDGNTLSLNGSLSEVEKMSAILYGKNLKKKSRAPIHTDILFQKPGVLSATIDLKKNKIVLDSVELNYEEGEQSLRHTFRIMKSTSKAETKPAQGTNQKAVVVDSTETE